MTTTTDTPACEVTKPAGADYVAPWQYDLPIPSRPFFGKARGITGRTIVVGTSGHQWADGSVASTATIEIIGRPDGLASGQARELAAALLQAADEVDGWFADRPGDVLGYAQRWRS